MAILLTLPLSSFEEKEPSVIASTLSGSQELKLYSLDKFQKSLSTTKGKWNVKVEDFFPDRNLLSNQHGC